MNNKFRLGKIDRNGFCKILSKNIEDYRKLGYPTKTLENIYNELCGGA